MLLHAHARLSMGWTLLSGSQKKFMNQELEKAVADRQPQNIQEAIDMCSAPLPTRFAEAAPLDSSAELGKMLWTLRCLTEEVRRIVFHLGSTERNENARLALRHLEDAQHRLKLAQPPSC